MPKSIHRPEYAVLTGQLRARREAAGLTQAGVAQALGWRSQSFMSDVESGARRLDLIELRDLCRVLGTDFVVFVSTLEASLQALPRERRRTAKRQAKRSR